MKNNYTAFPHNDNATKESYLGMTLGDYFAAQAIPEAMRIVASNVSKVEGSKLPGGLEKAVARMAYNIAQAMLDESEQRHDI